MSELETLSDAALDALNRRLRERASNAEWRGDLKTSTNALSFRGTVIMEQLRRAGWPVPTEGSDA